MKREPQHSAVSVPAATSAGLFVGGAQKCGRTDPRHNPGNFPGFSSRARHVSTRQAQTTEPLRRLTVRSPSCRRGLPAAARSASCSRGRCSLRTPQTRAAPRAAATRRGAALGVSPDFTQHLRRGFDRPPRPVRGLSRFWTTATESLHQKRHLTWVGCDRAGGPREPWGHPAGSNKFTICHPLENTQTPHPEPWTTAAINRANASWVGSGR